MIVLELAAFCDTASQAEVSATQERPSEAVAAIGNGINSPFYIRGIGGAP
jgi:hypothetical protein